MKKYNLLATLFISLFMCSLSSCSDDESVSQGKLLPSQIIQKYYNFNNFQVVNKYTYDDKNRLTNIWSAETNDVGSEGVSYRNIKNKAIKYDADGRVVEANTTSSDNSAISVISTEKYSYDGDKININKDGKDFYTIQISAQNRTLTYALVGESKYLANYQLDDKGNVFEYAYYRGDTLHQFQYTTDQKNGIFKQVNTPRWFLITQTYFFDYQLENMAKKFIFNSAENKWLYLNSNKIQYNKDDYPLSVTTDEIGVSSFTMSIQYVPTK